jgi:hypothetical protein
VRTIFLINLTVWFLLALPSPVSACTCRDESDLRAFRGLRSGADAIFVGRAVGQTIKGGTNFLVEQYWKGSLKRQEFIYTAQESTCAVGFADGERYLVFAIANDKGELNTNLCLKPGRVRDRAGYLRRLGRGKLKTT